MNVEKKILDFDNSDLFISSRLLRFLLDNALKAILSDGFKEAAQNFTEENDLNQKNELKFPLDTMLSFINICRKANASTDQFYLVGNKTHEIHILLSSYLNEYVSKQIDWSAELNIIKLTLINSGESLSIAVELNQIIFIDYKSLVVPLKSLLKGFFDRMFIIFFGSKPQITETKNGFNSTYKRTKVSSFDFIKFISNEEFIFSRMQQFLEQTKEDTINDKIYYFLFRDIKFSIEEIASKLNLSVRTLQRSLKEEGLSFREIKENIRKELSLRYLQDDSLLIHDVCMLLGYSERGAFEKAFKKWYGKSPTDSRKDLT